MQENKIFSKFLLKLKHKVLISYNRVLALKEFKDEKFTKFDNSSNNNSDINTCDDIDIIFHFKELLNNYNAKNKDINNNFYLDIRRNLLKDFNNILNNFAPNYGSRANFGRAGLADYPTIYFIDIIHLLVIFIS